MTAYERIFSAVFPPASDASCPTPAATPLLGTSDFGESFGSPSTQETVQEIGATEQIKWNRAWHTATTYLSLPNNAIKTLHTEWSQEVLESQWTKPFTSEVSQAVAYVVSDESYGRQIRKQLKTDDLLQWYLEEVIIRHYLAHVKPGLIKVYLSGGLSMGG